MAAARLVSLNFTVLLQIGLAISANKRLNDNENDSYLDYIGDLSPDATFISYCFTMGIIHKSDRRDLDMDQAESSAGQTGIRMVTGLC